MILLLLALTAADKGRLSGIVHLKGVTPANAAPVVLYVTGFSEESDNRIVKMHQRDKAFVPDVLPVTVGQTVEFSNDDIVLHNVFSISKARAFDLGMTKKPESKRIQLSKTGIIDVYCNIHPQMVGTILVLPNRAFAIADKDGRYRIDAIPAGDYKIYAWSRRSDVQSKPVSITAGGSASLDWDIMQDKAPEQHKDKYGKDYKAPKY